MTDANSFVAVYDAGHSLEYCLHEQLLNFLLKTKYIVYQKQKKMMQKIKEFKLLKTEFTCRLNF